MTDPRREKADSYISDYSLNADRYQEDGLFHKSLFANHKPYKFDHSYSTVKELIEYYQSNNYKGRDWKELVRNRIKVLKKWENPRPELYYVTFDYKLNKDEIFPLPFESHPNQSFKDFIKCIRVILDKWNYRVIDRDEYIRLTSFMKVTKIKRGHETLASVFL